MRIEEREGNNKKNLMEHHLKFAELHAKSIQVKALRYYHLQALKTRNFVCKKSVKNQHIMIT